VTPSHVQGAGVFVAGFCFVWGLWEGLRVWFFETGVMMLDVYCSLCCSGLELLGWSRCVFGF